MVRHTTLALSTLLAGLAVLLCACDESPAIRQYDAPKAPAPRQATAPAIEPNPNASAHHDHSTVAWTVPADWRLTPEAGGPRLATFHVGPEDRPIEVRVTVFPGDVGGVLANVNRWRGEVGLEPVTDLRQLSDVVTTFQAHALQGIVLDIRGQARPEQADQPVARTLAAMIAGPDRSWFVKATDEATRLDAVKDSFVAFTRSFHFDHDAHHGPTAAQPKPGTPSGEPAMETIGWEKPGNWHRDPNPGQFALAAFNVADDYGASRMTVTRLSGQAGGLLANINRWRGQVGLSPIASLDEQRPTALDIADSKGGLIDLVGPEGDDPPRILVVIYPRGQHTWFFKMEGTRRVLDAHRADFVRFVESIRFEAPQP